MFRPQLPSANAWRVAADPVHGTTRVRDDACGRPTEVELADGTRFTFERDPRGNLRSISAGFFQLIIDPPSPGNPCLRVADPRGATDVRWDRGRTETRRDRFAVRVYHDDRSGLRRVEVPGLSQALVYDWDRDGSGTIELDGVARLADLKATPNGVRVDTALGGWEESRGLGRVTLRTWGADDALLTVEIEHDLLGRVLSRRWSDGTVETFERDKESRVSRWIRSGERPDERTYHYDGEHLAVEVRAGESWIRELDSAGRVLTLTGPGDARVSYRYDERGRRIVREECRRTTRYVYDALGQLTVVEDSANGRVELEFDGLGRRIGRAAAREHRDQTGRLWSTTDAAGKLLHLFVWLDDRLIARVDGPTADRLAEVYVPDPLGTPLVILSVPSTLLRLNAPPFGAIADSARPSLYGHLGDPSTGLIHFGAREYDPELGLFLTPDTWDGGATDPRRWAGLTDAMLKQRAEIPGPGAHPYALCRFDPAGRVDRDGHLSVINSIASFILVPTWAWPLTAISLFFFLPLDLLYGEILFRLFLLIKGDRPFSTPYTIFNSIWATGSSRQGIAALGLNGLLPGIVTGHFDLHAERAVTIGNVIWIDRHELNRMERPTILELTNLTGWNADPTKDSVLHIVGTTKKGKRFHAAYWTRGYGNKLAVTAGPPEVLTLDDGQFELTRPDGTKEMKTLAPAFLAKPFPLDFPLDKPATLEAQEFIYDKSAAGAAGPKIGEVTLVDTWQAALQMDAKSGLATNDFVEINGKNLDPIHRQVVLVAADPDYDIVVVAENLPAGHKDKSLKVSRLIEDASAQEIPDWTQDGANTKLKATVTAPPDEFFKIATAKRVRVLDPAAVPAAVPPGVAAPPPGVTIYATVKQSTVTLKLSAPLTTAAAVGAAVLHAIENGDVGKANLPDPATPEKLKWKGDKGGIGKDDLISITAGGDTTFARVKDSSGDDLTVELLAPKLGAAAAVDVDLRLLKDRTNDQLKATVVTGGVDDIAVKFALMTHRPGNILHFQNGNTHQFRTLKAWSEVRLELSDPVPGAGSNKLKAAVEDKAFDTQSGVKVSELKRFFKSTGGTKPADFGMYPGFLHRLWSKGAPAAIPTLPHAIPYACEFFAHVAGPPAFDPDFRASWTHATVGADQYVIFDHDLPIKVITDATGVHYTWHRDSDDNDPDSLAWFDSDPVGTPIKPIVLEIREFTAGTTKQNFTVGEGRVCVPEHPLIADTEADALRQHELHHALQATHWGPLMGALPIGGIQSLVVDFDGAKTSANPPSWLKDDKAPPDTKNKFKEFQGAQYASIGALMEVVWAYLLTFGQATNLHFEDWNKLFNPFTANIIDAIGKKENEDLDPNQPLSKSPGLAILQLLATATDLRSWVPFLGWVPLILPDGPRSFLEQGASRASGDLYSTIVSADDKFNRESDTRGFLPDFVPDYHTANIEKPLGEVTRMMVFTASRGDRIFTQALANAPGSPLTYAGLYFDSEMVSVGPRSAALMHPDLYEPLAPAPPLLSVDGPASSPTAVGFFDAPASARFRPRLRALTPLPAQVIRSAGFYFVPGSPAKFDFIAYYRGGKTLPSGLLNPLTAKDPSNPLSKEDLSQDAKTQEVTLTVTEGDVTFGGDKVPYVKPLATGTVPAVLGTPLKRFITELVELKFGDQFIGADPDDKNPGATHWELNLCTTAAASPPPSLAANTVTPTAQTHRWDLQLGKTPGDVRVRVFRIYRKNDSTDDSKNDHSFDLTFDPKTYPSLKNVRSYLDKDIWVLVRDFQFKIEDLPELTTTGKSVSIDTESLQKIDLALALPGDVKPKVTVNWDRTKSRPVPDGDIPNIDVEKAKDTSTYPHGEVWVLKPLGGVLEEDSAYKVTVTFGKAPANSVDRTLDVAVTPFIRLKGSGAPPFEAAFNQPCTLNIEGGAAPYKVTDDGLPSDTTAVVNGNNVVVTVAKAPGADKKVVLTITDANGKKGRRTITVRKT